MTDAFLIKDTPSLMETNLPVFSQIELSIQQMVFWFVKIEQCIYSSDRIWKFEEWRMGLWRSIWCKMHFISDIKGNGWIRYSGNKKELCSCIIH